MGWPLAIASILCYLSTGASASLSRQLLTEDGISGSAETAAQDKSCRKNEFFPLPTAWHGADGYLVSSKVPSARAYCKQKGFASVGALKGAALAKAKLSTSVLDLATGNPCTSPRCTFLSIVECIPARGVRCAPDAKGNRGVGNSGLGNWGHRNRGDRNLGSSNSGSRNFGNANQGDGSVGCNGAGVGASGLVGLGSRVANALQVFSTCGESRIVLQPPAPLPAASPSPTPNSQQCTQWLDLCVVMDGSTGAKAWAAQQQLALSALDSLSQPTGRLAVYQFAEEAWPVVSPTGMEQAGKASAQVEAARPLGGASRKLNQGIAMCTSALMGFETGNAMRMLVMTASAPPSAASTAATYAKKLGIEVIAVGLGAGVSLEDLDEVASTNKAVLLPSFGSTPASATAALVSGKLCEEGECQRYPVALKGSSDHRASASSASSKIVNGQAASFGMFPFVARVVLQVSEESYSLCTGSLVTPRVVLVAAHCVWGVEVYSVTVGVTNAACPGNAPTRKGRAIPHPNWIRANISAGIEDKNDIAIIILNKQVNTIKPLPLATSDQPFPLGTQALMAGFGAEDVDGGGSSWLMWSAQKHAPCGNLSTSSTHLCTGGTFGGKPSVGCWGDSGGPTWLLNPNPIQVGVSSASDNCRSLTISTSIMVLRDWIDGELAKISEN